MLYIVDVAIDAENLAHELSRMRTWLDHMKFQAIGFRQIPGTNICRVDFESEQEVRAFAQAFAGQVLKSQQLLDRAEQYDGLAKHRTSISTEPAKGGIR
jgi:hypothetical protein